MTDVAGLIEKLDEAHPMVKRTIVKGKPEALIDGLQTCNRVTHLERDGMLSQVELREYSFLSARIELAIQLEHASPHSRHGILASRNNWWSLFEPQLRYAFFKPNTSRIKFTQVSLTPNV